MPAEPAWNDVTDLQPAPNFFKTPYHFCVLIPCFNDEAGLITSLQSIFYADGPFAVVVVDDGSAQPVSKQRLQEAVPHITNLELLRLEKNSGITTALNTGLRWILDHTNSLYIARLDCRDTCHPERFSKQVHFLNSHPQVGLLGSWCSFRNAATGHSYTYTTPLEQHAIIKAMHLRNVFIHPAVMFRTGLLQITGTYPYNFPFAEDYALFWTLLQAGGGAIVAETLVQCAIVPQGISLSNRRAQLRSRGRVVQHFGTNSLLKLMNWVRLYILLITPDLLLLRLKMRKAAD